MTLTPKQEAFAQAYVEASNASEAYRRSYSAVKMAQRTVEVEASKLLSHPEVTLRVSELQKRAQQRHDITVDTITAMLIADRELAREKGQPSAAVSAVMGLAKIHGLILDKAQISGNEESPLVTRIELVAGSPPERACSDPSLD